ncbi:malonate transporter subunit MadM [Robiginitalea biformata]|uniref:Malonate/sodium symporter MadM subunit n=1 Tax=Robiginitalea biformata (strain ATCC BAA-864 / DSM 15991 / KCTC 12146 / HTCC2501) TaxID=313596 RepID=A4CJD6_ROBBH|nr:malonate transporter subunit MadM [Robiginitalea biformata]EAR17044.1 Malonate/sodium symporter MadM subunit [Robiginitalea biformata HTCC2501]
MDGVETLIERNGLILAFLVVGLIMGAAYAISRYLTRGRLPGAALAILIGLGLAFLGGERGIADHPLFAGMAVLGGSMFRDFAVVATAMGADLETIKQAGKAGVVALLSGVLIAFVAGAMVALALGYSNPVDITTIAAGACTYIVGPVTGTALGATSDVIAISVAAGVVKTLAATIGTPFIARYIGLNNPHSAMVFGGLIGTTSGVVAGLAATDARLVPYGALTATFYTGIGCLLCPSVLYLLVRLFV